MTHTAVPMGTERLAASPGIDEQLSTECANLHKLLALSPEARAAELVEIGRRLVAMGEHESDVATPSVHSQYFIDIPSVREILKEEGCNEPLNADQLHVDRQLARLRATLYPCPPIAFGSVVARLAQECDEVKSALAAAHALGVSNAAQAFASPSTSSWIFAWSNEVAKSHYVKCQMRERDSVGGYIQ